jgi:CHAT domain-containing protein/tetratricopeptide (TPR) repeat protein
MILAGCGACRFSAPPEELYREAERLRLEYEQSAGELAIAKYEAAADAWTRGGSPQGAARALQGAGLTYAQRGLLHRSRQAYEAALAAARASGDAAVESEILSETGIAQSLVALRESDFEQAQARCSSALALSRRAGGGRLEARAFQCLGEVAYNSGQRERALDQYRRAEAAAAGVGDRRTQAEALACQASVHSDRDEFSAAESCFFRAKRVWDEMEDARGSAITRVGLSKLQERRGNYQEALIGLQEALAVLERVGDAVWEGAALSAIGSVYMRTGEPAAARDYWERALGRFQTAALSPFSVDLLRTLGEAYLAAGDDVSALARFERALALGRELGDDHWQAYALQDIGTVHLDRGDLEKAVAVLGQSLAIQERFRDPRVQARTRVALGDALRRSGAWARARTSFEAAATIGRKSEDRLTEAAALHGLALVAVTEGQLDAARSHVERALQVAESLRSAIDSRDIRTAYAASVHHYYQTHVDVLMRLHDARRRGGLAAAAFEASERARARALIDGLAEAGVNLRQDGDAALLRRERELLAEFEAWARRQREFLDGRGDPARGRALADEYRRLDARHDALDGEIRRRSPHYAAVARPAPLSLAQVQQRVLDDDTLLLEYALGQHRSYLWAVSKRGFTAHALPAGSEIAALAERLYSRLTIRHALSGPLPERQRQAEEADFQYWEDAAELSRLVLAPARDAFAHRRIVVVADGALQHVPFAALPDPGRPGERVPMLVDHEIVSLPSATALAVLRGETAERQPPAGALAVLADPVFEDDDPRLRAVRRASAQAPGRAGSGRRPGPDRPGPTRFSRLAATRLEADVITAAAGAEHSLQRLGLDASRAAAMAADLSRYRVVHFATHGILDNANPGMSGIMLSLFGTNGEPVDGFLRLHDIYGLALRAELVVLSACSTALGRQVSGEGLVGLVRGFMYAGAKRVVASLWKVDDEATGELMRRFYEGMFRQGLAPSAALRQAQLDLWRQPRWQAPFFWAAFTLQGEWQP